MPVATRVPSSKRLPDNAYTELRVGESYEPYVPAESIIPEVTLRAVFIGLGMAVIFTLSAAYLGMKVGQVFEAAIPIAVLAVGLKHAFPRKSTVSENVIIQSIGSTSAVVVSGAIFTLPALYVLKLQPPLWSMILACFLGACLGILFLIPLRRYFCVEMHGKLPYPEATATTEILVTGESGGEQAKLLLYSMGLGGIYEFITTTCALWQEHIDFLFTRAGQVLADKARMVIKLDAIPSILGLGYVIGLRNSLILISGSFLSVLILVPTIYFVGQHLPQALAPGSKLIGQMDAEEIFRLYVQRRIAVGCIAFAGIVAILKSLKIIVGSFALGFKGILSARQGHSSDSPRTDRDVSMVLVFAGIVLTGLFSAIYLRTLIGWWGAVWIAVAIVLLMSFMFTTVAANAIAIVARNPISGMTMLTIIISSFIFLRVGISGSFGMVVVLMIGCMVCTALALAGGFVTDLKIGYWLGTTPRRQEIWKFLGVAISSIAVVYTIHFMSGVYAFSPDDVAAGRTLIDAPQANIMKAIASSMMANEPITWLLYGIGAVIVLICEMLSVPSMIFALGMYLPLELNAPALLGGFISYAVLHSSKQERVTKQRWERGTLIASGFIAGGALLGVLGVVLRNFHWERFISAGIPYIRMFDPNTKTYQWMPSTPHGWFISYGQIFSLVLYAGLCLYLYWDSCRKAKDE
ncbi:MAG: oligopeptide transporter, OPT family [Acidobacteriia bacterium]|nr:oligopeptide transporter, OPT family [Terriglobia bacterium]